MQLTSNGCCIHTIRYKESWLNLIKYQKIVRNEVIKNLTKEKIGENIRKKVRIATFSLNKALNLTIIIDSPQIRLNKKVKKEIRKDVIKTLKEIYWFFWSINRSSYVCSQKCMYPSIFRWFSSNGWACLFMLASDRPTILWPYS